MAQKPRSGKPEARSTAPNTRPQQNVVHAAFEQHQATAVDSLLRLLNEPVASVLTCLVIGIALALPLCVFLLLQNLQQLGAGLQSDSSISLYMESSIELPQLEALAAELGERDDIEAVRLITPEEALAEFEQESGFADVLEGLDDNPLPPVLLVTPDAATAEAITALRDLLAQQEGVNEAQLDLEWLQRLNAVVSFALRLTYLLAALLGLGVLLVIGNTVRLSIENRRAEIVVVKLVGGTDSWVSRPFLYTGFWYGMGGGVVALALVGFSLMVLSGPVSRLISAYQSDFDVIGLGISQGFIVLIASAALGLGGAWISVLRHLRAIEPR
ncbi:MAG: permease-like cell division protein FtsX [Pseudohongiellaceae bacterium]